MVIHLLYDINFILSGQYNYITYNLYSIRCFVYEISTSCLGSVYSGQRRSRALSRLLNVRNWCLEIFFVSWSWSKGKSWIKFLLA